MVNVRIYLKKEHDAKELIHYLLQSRLVASASVEENVMLHKWDRGELKTEVHSVIIAHSKSLLFNAIVQAVEDRVGEGILICSIPIVSSSRFYDEAVRAGTMPI